MAQRFGIVDLFAGPGGLSEGFSSLGDTASVSLSVEMDPHAIRTLRLRALLRQFRKGFPAEYYDALARFDTGGKSDLILEVMMDSFPKQWEVVEKEVLQLTLGGVGVFDLLSRKLDDIRESLDGNTILIGGPPCQAYSLAGRSRNRGIRDYVPENDGRHYLYREYVQILERLRPAAFVMENVKGILSSQVNGGPIFLRILDDLQSAAGSDGGYRLMSIAVPRRLAGTGFDARDFLVRAEDFGVPQQRHRIFIVGVRSDRAHALQTGSLEMP